MTDFLSNGTFADLWTVNHLLSGFIIAGWLVFLGVPKWQVVLIATTLFWGWEIFEYIYHVEPAQNQIVDLIADYAGLVVLFAAGTSLQPHTKGILAAATAVFLVLEVYCLVSYLSRPHEPGAVTGSHARRNLLG